MRLTVDLDESEYNQLRDAASRERRDPRDQIVVLAMKALRDTEIEAKVGNKERISV